MSQRRHSSRRTVLKTIGSLGIASVAGSAAVSAGSDSNGARDFHCGRSNRPEDTPRATRYTAVVDRIVDGRHVVLLLEQDGELVDQHVVPRSDLEDVAESDILVVVMKDDELLMAQQLPKRPGRSATEPSPQERLDELVTEEGST